MPKTFHGKIDETVDALIILEACRQGVMPRITRRLLAAERGETGPPPPPPPQDEDTDNYNSPSSYSTRHSTRLSAATPSSATNTSSSSSSFTPVSALSLSPTTVTSRHIQSSSSALFPSTSSSSSPSTSSTAPNPSLIIPGSVFVFDEQESGICRWTDGKIWSPSRISGNFLVYRELYRKLPNQKCFTTLEKILMKDGTGLKDQALREKVDKEKLVVMGCMKGTFVLKNGGLIKKTICVKGVNLMPPEELKKRLEGPSLAVSRRSGPGGAGGRVGGRANGAGHNLLPGFSTRGTQHLVCYEKPGGMDDLHGPREYLELLNLPVSKTFVMMQSYRIPIKISPLEFGQQPLDPADEYIHSSRIVEAHSTSTKQLGDDSPSPPRASTPKTRAPPKRCRAQGKRPKRTVDDHLDSGDEEGFQYLANDANSGDNYYDSEMSASRPAHSRTPVATTTRREVKTDKSANKSVSSYNLIAPRPHILNRKHRQVEEQSERDEQAVVLKSSATPRINTAHMQEFQESMSNNTSYLNQGVGELTVRGYKAAGGQWRIASSSSSRSSSSGSGSINLLPQYQGGGCVTEFAPPPPHMDVHSYHQGPPDWQHNLDFQRQQQQQQQQHQQTWNHGGYNYMHERRTFSGLYPAQQHPIPYHEYLPLPPMQLQVQQHRQTQQQGFSGDVPMYYNTASATPAMIPTSSMHDFQGYYGYPTGGHRQASSPLGSTAAFPAAENGQIYPLDSSALSAAVSDVDQSMNDYDTRLSDASYSPVQRPLQQAQHTGSPWSTASVDSRGSSLSSSLTLSPVAPSKSLAGRGPSSAVGSENARQTIVAVQRFAGDYQGSSGSRSTIGCQATLGQAGTSKGTVAARHQGQQVSVSFTRNACGLSSLYPVSVTIATSSSATVMAKDAAHAIVTSMPLDVAMPTSVPETSHSTLMDSAAYSASSYQAKDPVPQLDQEQDQSSRRPFREPYVPVMTFSSGTVLGTSTGLSPQGSPSPITQAHEPYASAPQVHQSNEGAFAAESTTTATTASAIEATATAAVSTSQTRDDDSTAKSHARAKTTNTATIALPVSHAPVDAILPHSPYSPQPHRQVFSPSGFLLHDLNGSDELDRLLDLQSQHHEMDIVGCDDERQEEEKDGVNGDEGSVQVFQRTTSLPLTCRTGESAQPSARPRMMSPGTLSALHHFSKEGSPPQNSTQSKKRSYTPNVVAGLLDLSPSSSSVGSADLGQKEYLLHHTRPPNNKTRVRQYGAAVSPSTVFGPRSGVEFGGNFEGYGYMARSSGGLESCGSGFVTTVGSGIGRADRQPVMDDDQPWAMHRQEDTTSSEIACQLFSGLDTARSGGSTVGGDGRVYASGMGIGIGTAIGHHIGGLSGYSASARQGDNGGATSVATYDEGGLRSIQTLQLSDQVEQYPFSEEQVYSRSVSSTDSLQHQQHTEGDDDEDRTEMTSDELDNPEDEAAMIRQHENADEEDDLGALGLYSEHLSDRASPIHELNEDYYYEDDEGMELRRSGHPQQKEEDLETTADKIGSQESDAYDYRYDTHDGDGGDMDVENGYYSNISDDGAEEGGQQRQGGEGYDGDLSSRREWTGSASSSQASTVSEEFAAQLRSDEGL
ncbi:hypothetical protein BGX24_012393 [Mortierella sp. AD032]|nr:hypothetical protein BGX24_012393 [Mortierella sp. AD032]